MTGGKRIGLSRGVLQKLVWSLHHDEDVEQFLPAVVYVNPDRRLETFNDDLRFSHEICDGLYQTTLDTTVFFCTSEDQVDGGLKSKEPAIVKITEITSEKEEGGERCWGKIKYTVLAKLDSEISMFHDDYVSWITNLEVRHFNVTTNMTRFHENLWVQRKSGQFCDVEVRFPDGKVIPAHKLVLCSNSSVFTAQFTTSIETNDKDFIRVEEDVDYIHFKDFLHFLYKGFTFFYSLKQMYDLLHLAQYYMVEELKEALEKHLAEEMTNNEVQEKEKLALHLFLNMRTRNDKIYSSICLRVDPAFFYSPLINKIDVHSWKKILTGRHNQQELCACGNPVTSDDVLIGVLKWAVANQTILRDRPSQVKELLDLINLEEISYRLVEHISSWAHLTNAIDKTNLIMAILSAKRIRSISPVNEIMVSSITKKNNRIPTYDNILLGRDFTDGWLHFSEDGVIEKTTLTNIDKTRNSTGLVTVTEVEVTRDLQENRAKVKVKVQMGGRIKPYPCPTADMVLQLIAYKTVDGCTYNRVIEDVELKIDFDNNSDQVLPVHTETILESFDTFLCPELTEYDGTEEQKPRVMRLMTKLSFWR